MSYLWKRFLFIQNIRIIFTLGHKMYKIMAKPLEDTFLSGKFQILKQIAASNTHCTYIFFSFH